MWHVFMYCYATRMLSCVMMLWTSHICHTTLPCCWCLHWPHSQQSLTVEQEQVWAGLHSAPSSGRQCSGLDSVISNQLCRAGSTSSTPTQESDPANYCQVRWGGQRGTVLASALSACKNWNCWAWKQENCKMQKGWRYCVCVQHEICNALHIICTNKWRVAWKIMA